MGQGPMKGKQMKNKISYVISVILIIAITMLFAVIFSKLNTKSDAKKNTVDKEAETSVKAISKDENLIETAHGIEYSMI